jgi:3alpha(or 20beta)-hydroxysteroid dehydrogenase
MVTRPSMRASGPPGQLCTPRAKAILARVRTVDSQFRRTVEVNSMHPGLVHTPLSEGVTKEFMARIPMLRGASPAEIANFIVFLISDESSYATAAEFVVDGG